MWKLSLRNICTNFSPFNTFAVPKLQQMSPPFDSDDCAGLSPASWSLCSHALWFLYPERILLSEFLSCLSISLKAKVRSTLNYLLFNLFILISYPCPVYSILSTLAWTLWPHFLSMPHRCLPHQVASQLIPLFQVFSRIQFHFHLHLWSSILCVVQSIITAISETVLRTQFLNE